MPPLPFADSSLAPDAVRTQAGAKVNLGLHVRPRRPDGFHGVETVLLPLSWADTLTAAPADVLTLACSDPALPTDGRNLVVRAAEALAAWAGFRDGSRPGARLHLGKHVPYGAGLGSGSSDAAAALRLLANLWALDVPEDAMHALAAGLGSDVPFFLDAEPALATGRGETLTPLTAADGTPYRMPFAMAVVVPAVHVSTAEAYRLVSPHDAPRPDLADAVRSSDPERWQREVVNQFQAPIEAAFPETRRAREALLAAGAAYASLSGSGSAVFGVFERARDARAAADEAVATGARVWTEPAIA